MDKIYYETEITKLLSSEDYHRQLNEDPYKKLIKEYDEFVTNENNGLTEKEVDYLVNFERKEINFYELPKIHKSKEICKTSESNYIENNYMEGPRSATIK